MSRDTCHPQDLGVFQQKAVQDCSFTVDRMEQFRTEFRASLLWLDNISQELNPEDREQLEKFRKVSWIYSSWVVISTDKTFPVDSQGPF